MKIEPTPEEVRATLNRLAAERNVSLSDLSLMLGRSIGYLRLFIRRGTPKRLDEDNRLRLAQFFGIDERELGARAPWRPKR